MYNLKIMTNKTPDNEPKKKESHGWIIFTCIGTILCIVLIFFVNEIIPIIEERYDVKVILTKPEHAKVIESENPDDEYRLKKQMEQDRMTRSRTRLEVDERLDLTFAKITWTAVKDSLEQQIYINLNNKKVVVIVRSKDSDEEVRSFVHTMPSYERAMQDLGRVPSVTITPDGEILALSLDYNLRPTFSSHFGAIGWISFCRIHDVGYFISDEHASTFIMTEELDKGIVYTYNVDGNILTLKTKGLDDITVEFNSIVTEQS